MFALPHFQGGMVGQMTLHDEISSLLSLRGTPFFCFAMILVDFSFS